MTETPGNESGRVRWTDEMLDKLTSNVSELRESVSELRESVSEVKDSVDGVRITTQGLLQLALQQQQENEARKAEIAEANRKYEEEKQESDRRFYTLLDEVRYLNRRGDRNNGES
ncbi:hypothetical protein [Argonema antarcticum]|uniref:hypothetical protein n=1 Tax=Argonema antarcticum TaxID=2942763 RepID=UPI00201101A5|nr:hypothetical protein [Argonema antarcticum]MCL1475406.1 hypothetical protein [Argonema antarcticum A004/B2]